MTHFLWSASSSGQCHYKVAWLECCFPKCEGGLGFKELLSWNDAAVLHQIWRINNKENSLWIKWLYATFLNSKPFWYMKIPSKTSWGFRKILNSRAKCLPFISYQLGPESNFLLWNDPWHNGKSLLETLGREILSIMQSDSMEKVVSMIGSSTWQNLSSNHVLAMEFRHICSQIHARRHDKILWNGCSYNSLGISDIWNTIRTRKLAPSWIGMIWHKFSVSKFSIMMWLIMKQRLLTKDRMARFGMTVNQSCLLCYNSLETHIHLFTECNYTKSIMHAWDVDFSLNWQCLNHGTIFNSGLEATKQMMTYLFIAAAWHAIWLERNSRCHVTGHALPPCHLIHDIKRRTREKLFSVKTFQKKCSRDPTLALLLY